MYGGFGRITGLHLGNPATATPVLRGCAATTDPATFVTRAGSRLLVDNQQFCFAGANIYWLGLDENVGGIAYPTPFRVDDALQTLRLMGGTVARSQTLGVSVGCSLCVEPAPGVFNEGALRHLDYAIAQAHQAGIRLIIPFVDEYHYYHGGKHTFTDWIGVGEAQFYTDPRVLAMVEQYIDTIITRVNTITGVAYRDDPTILAWETGNEIHSPASWTQTIAHFIKGLDAHHLIMDGRQAQTGDPDPFQSHLELSEVDLYTSHYYYASFASVQHDAALAAQAGKAFVIGEFDWTTPNLLQFLDTIQSDEQISGDLFWSLFSHGDISGYVQHGDGFTLHYPGDTPAMRQAVELLREHAYAMRGMTPPPLAAPGAPLIIGTGEGALTWRGGWGGDTYSIEHSANGEQGPWQVICDRCTNDLKGFFSIDATSIPNVWYRIRAFNVVGQPGPYSPTARGP